METATTNIALTFEFGKYTEVTDLAFKVNPSYKNDGYIRFFVCPDTNNFWFCRILKDVNKDYENEEGSYILERNKIPNSKKHENLSISKVHKIIEEDDFSNWDFNQSYDVNKLIQMVDGGFGILNLKED